MHCLLCENYDYSRCCCRLGVLKLQSSCFMYRGASENLGFNLYTILAREIERVLHPRLSKVLYVIDGGIPTLRAVSEDAKEMKRIFKLVYEVLSNVQKYAYPIIIEKECKVYPIAERYLVLTSANSPALRLDMFVYTSLDCQDKKKAGSKKKRKVRKEK